MGVKQGSHQKLCVTKYTPQKVHGKSCQARKRFRGACVCPGWCACVFIQTGVDKTRSARRARYHRAARGRRRSSGARQDNTTMQDGSPAPCLVPLVYRNTKFRGGGVACAPGPSSESPCSRSDTGERNAALLFASPGSASRPSGRARPLCHGWLQRWPRGSADGTETCRMVSGSERLFATQARETERLNQKPVDKWT